MIAIAKHEFLQLFKSFKSILVILVLISASFFVAKNGEQLIQILELGGEDTDIYYVGLLLVIQVFGPLFVFSLSHDAINREVHSKTIRFLLTRTSYANILFGKLIGVLGFWLVCILFSNLIIIFYAKDIDFYLFLQMMILLIYSISLTFLLSVVITKPFMSMFLSVVIGIALPIISLVLYSTNKWWGVLGYLTPYEYLIKDDWKIIIVLLISTIIMWLSYIIFKRRAY